MKKLILVVLALVLNLCLFSCSKPDISEGIIETEACCGDDNHLPPPPPPPPGE